MIANAGFFAVNLFSFLQPYALTLTTPPEMQPLGWSTTDLWCAPLITGLYATLTHAQPFWACCWRGSARCPLVVVVLLLLLVVRRDLGKSHRWTRRWRVRCVRRFWRGYSLQGR